LVGLRGLSGGVLGLLGPGEGGGEELGGVGELHPRGRPAMVPCVGSELDSPLCEGELPGVRALQENGGLGVLEHAGEVRLGP